VTPFEWTRWRLRAAAASFLFMLAAKIHDMRNSAILLGAELVFFGSGMSRASAQGPISHRSHRRIR